MPSLKGSWFYWSRWARDWEWWDHVHRYYIEDQNYSSKNIHRKIWIQYNRATILYVHRLPEPFTRHLNVWWKLPFFTESAPRENNGRGSWVFLQSGGLATPWNTTWTPHYWTPEWRGYNATQPEQKVKYVTKLCSAPPQKAVYSTHSSPTIPHSYSISIFAQIGKCILLYFLDFLFG